MTRFLRVSRVTSPSQVSSQLFTSPSQVPSLYLCDLSVTRVQVADSSFHLWYCKILLQLQILKHSVFSSIFYFKITYSCDCKAEITAAITPVFSVTWSFINHSNMLIWWSRIIFLLLMLKQLCCLICFLWNCHCFFKIFGWIESKKKHLFIFKDIVNIFTFTIYQFNAYLMMNKSVSSKYWIGKKDKSSTKIKQRQYYKI